MQPNELDTIEISELEKIIGIQLSALEWEKQVARWKFEGITAGQLRLFGHIREKLDEINKIASDVSNKLMNHRTFFHQIQEKEFYIQELIKKI